MSRGNKTQVAYAMQPNPSVIPTTGWKTVPYKSIGFNPNYELLDSETISDSRIQQEGAVTKASLGGELDCELAKDVYDDLLAASAFNDWKTDTLTFGGDVRKAIAFEEWHKDINLAHYFGGCYINTMKLDISNDKYASIAFGIVGADYQNKKNARYAVSPTVPANVQRVSRLQVEDISIDGVTTRGVACVSQFGFQVDNSIQTVACLGDGVFSTTLLELMTKMTGSLTLAYSPRTQDIVNKQMTGGTISISATLKFADGSRYRLDIPKAQVKGEIPTGNELLNQQLNFTVVAQAPTLTRLAAA